MGTDELTPEAGSRERRNPGPNPEEPVTFEAAVSGRGSCVLQARRGPQPQRAPGSHWLLVPWGWQGAAGMAGGREGRGEEPGHAGSKEWPPRCTSSAREMEDREVAIGLAAWKWLSPPMRVLPVGQVATGAAVGTGDEQRNKAGVGNEGATKGPSLWVQQRGTDLGAGGRVKSGTGSP